MTQKFLYCFDCKELNYAIPNKNDALRGASAATNHLGHHVHVFNDPLSYPAPIRTVLIKLEKGVDISVNEMLLFKLALELELNI